MPPNDVPLLYRYYTGWDSFLTVPVLECEKWYVTKETEKGYWISLTYMNPEVLACYSIEDQRDYRKSNWKWVNKDSSWAYAHVSKKDALNHYIARSTRRIGYLEADLMRVKDCLKDAERFLKIPEDEL